MEPELLLVEFGFTEAGEQAFLPYQQRALEELRATDGCLEVITYQRPGRKYLFYTVWRDHQAIAGWVRNPFHREVLMPGFRVWCDEAWFGYWGLREDRDRVRKCPVCGRWSRARPGWSLANPAACSRCGAPFPSAAPGPAEP